MIPIAKNISVIDEQGNKYEATYAKRAKGLIKNGRARFVDENTICLACPPNNFLEDNEMSDIIKENEQQNQIPEMNQELPDDRILSMEYVLSRIDKIINDTSYIHEALTAIRDMQVNEGMNNQDGDRARGDAVRCTVQSRETTNQQLIKLLEKMYDDLKPRSSSLKEKALDLANRTLNNTTSLPEEKELVLGVLETIRHIEN